MPNPEPDLGQLEQAAALLLPPGQVLELRVIGSHRGTVSGYYDDPAALVRDAALWSGKAGGIYVTPNPVRPDLLARSCNRATEFARHTTKADDILARRWLLIDFDAKRPAGISASEAEHRAALTRAAECATWLIERQWPPVLYADSGNGAHLLARVDLPNDPETHSLFERCLNALAAQWDTPEVSVDPTTKDASRVWKFYGTAVCKGDSIPTRPHRIARILQAEGLAPVPRALLEDLAALVPVAAVRTVGNGASNSKAPLATGSRGDYSSLDAVAWFGAHGAYGRPLANGAHAVLCPWAGEHSDHRPAEDSDTVVWPAQGEVWPTFHCSHAHCAQRTLKDVLAFWGDADRFCSLSFTSAPRWPVSASPAVFQDTAPVSGRIEEQSRQHALLTQAGALRRTGLEPAAIEAALQVVNAERCEPPLPVDAVAEIAAQVGRYEPAEAQDWRVGAAGVATFTGLDPLIRIGSTPPRYKATVRGRVIELSGKEMAEWRLFKFRCITEMGCVLELPSNPIQEKVPLQIRWEREFIGPALERMNRLGQFEEAPEDAGEPGAAWQSILRWFENIKPDATIEDVAAGRAARIDDHYVFKGESLRHWMQANRVDKLPPDQIWHVVRAHGGKPQTHRIGRGTVFAWRVPVPGTGADCVVSVPE
jgi:hypothetical protein